MTKPLVYIAAPYTLPDPVTNTRRAITAGMALWNSGLAAVIIPHLSIVTHLLDPRDVSEWYRYDLDLVEHCDGLLRLPGPSCGADAELEHARAHGIPTYTAAGKGTTFNPSGPIARWIRKLEIRTDPEAARIKAQRR